MLRETGDARHRATGRLRRGRRLGAIGACALAVVCGCVIPPRSFKAVRTPREGRAVNGSVAIVYSGRYQVNLGGPERLHPFDVRKYAKVYLSLLAGGLLRPADVFVPAPVTPAELLRVHTPAYLASLRHSGKLARYLEAPAVAILPAGLADAGILEPFRHATGGTILAGRLALTCGVAVNLGGGFHHARGDRGEGFCIYNDLAVAIRTLQHEGLIDRALIVDLDVHQGNGSAVVFAGDDVVFTFSMHQRDIYPVPKETSDLDVELPAGTGDAEYLALLKRHLPEVVRRARPDIVFLQAGADTLDGDPLAGLRMTRRGIVARDAVVIDYCAARKIPVAVCLGGGYSPRAWRVQADSVARTLVIHGRMLQRPYPPRKPNLKETLYAK